jgi:DNA primase
MVIRKSADKQYDRFRDRIMFPILDRRGHTIAFGGRIIDDGEPKYLNSPETEIFHKGYELYGFYEARQAVRKLTRIIVVEGYMDVVALAQNGIEYAVASLGTATTKDQIQKLFRSVHQIVFCYDGDNAGRKAAWRALENTLPIIRDGLEASFLFLPEGEDPDSLVRKEGKTAFEQRLDQATPLSEFLFKALTQEINIETMEGKAKLENKAKPLLGKIPESIFKDLMYQRLSELVGISVEKLSGESKQQETASTSVQPAPPRSTRKIKQNATRDAIALLLHHPQLALVCTVPDTFRDTSLQGFALLHQLHETILNNPGLSSSALLERWRGTNEFEILQKLLQRDVQGTDDKQAQEAVYKDAVQQLLNKYKDERYEVLDAKLRESGLSDTEMQEYKELLKR